MKLRIFKLALIVISLNVALNVRESRAEVTLLLAGQILSVIGTIVKSTWHVLEQQQLVGNYSLDEKHKEVVRSIGKVMDNLNTFELNMHASAASTVHQLQRFIQAEGKFQRKLETLSDVTNRIAIQMNNMKEYSKNLSRIENYTLHDFAASAVAHNPNSILGLVDRMYTITLGTPELEDVGISGIFHDYLHYVEASRNSVCNLKTSEQQTMIKLYNAILITGLKGYSMLQFSWMLLKTYGKGNFTVEADASRINFNKNIRNIQVILATLLNQADRTVYKCDPNNHVEGKTFLQLTRLLQGFVENEQNMNEDTTCWRSCDAYRYEEQGCFGDCSSRFKCKGKISNCWNIESKTEVCHSPANSTRRYEFLRYEDGQLLGQNTDCNGRSGSVESWMYWVVFRCSYCFCVCDEEGPKSDRFFSLRPSLSDIADNRIVTGIKFVKEQRIIHLQIQEGKLMPEGVVDRNTLQWRPVNNFSMFDKDVRIGRDLHVLTMRNRSIDLDDLETDETHIVTGVKFGMAGTHLQLQVRVTEFDYATGALINPETSSYWMSSPAQKRTKLELNKPDIPTRPGSLPSTLFSTPNQYTDFTHSHIDADAAQSTIPFLDAQSVTADPPTPLAGLGLYHRGRLRSGGFIAPKLIMYNYANRLKPEIVV